MNIFTFATDVIRNITLVDVGAGFMAGTLVYFAIYCWQSIVAKPDAQPQLSAEQAEVADSAREDLDGAAPIAIVTTAGVVLVLVIVGAVAVWQMAIR